MLDIGSENICSLSESGTEPESGTQPDPNQWFDLVISLIQTSFIKKISRQNERTLNQNCQKSDRNQNSLDNQNETRLSRLMQ